MATQVREAPVSTRKGKLYVSGNRARSVTYVVVRAQDGIDPITGTRVNGKEVTIDFRDHKWDSAQAQKAHQWTDEMRKRCENYLENEGDYHPQKGHLFGCPDWQRGDGTGIFLDQTLEQKFFRSETELKAALGADLNRVCTAMKEVDDAIVQCGNPVVGEEEYCASCAALVASQGD